jgi:hypothetical protein
MMYLSDFISGSTEVSPTKIKKRISKLERKLEERLKSGDIFGAKDTKERLLEERKELEKAQNGFVEVKSAFENVVDNMNRDLNGLHGFLKK